MLYQSLIRANRFDWVLEKGTEIGVARFVPVMATRTQLQLDEPAPRAPSAGVASSSKQRSSASAANSPPSSRPVIRRRDAQAPGLKLVPWEDEREQRLGDYLRSLKAKPRAVSVFIGPEGGYEASEIDLARESGAILVTLGRRVMRAETAAIIATGIVLHELDA